LAYGINIDTKEVGRLTSAKSDQTKDRVKEAFLTGNKDLQSDGGDDRRAADLKEQVEKVADKSKEMVGELGDKACGEVSRNPHRIATPGNSPIINPQVDTRDREPEQ
jgi:uncharacterized protein YjbJ (UPF0337 family)